MMLRLLVTRGEALHAAALQPEVLRSAIGEEGIAAGNDSAVQFVKVTLMLLGRTRIVAVDLRPGARPLYAPLEGTHHAIGVAGGKPGLPVANPALVKRAHRFSYVYSKVGFRGQRSVFSGQRVQRTGLSSSGERGKTFLRQTAFGTREGARLVALAFRRG